MPPESLERNRNHDEPSRCPPHGPWTSRLLRALLAVLLAGAPLPGWGQERADNCVTWGREQVLSAFPSDGERMLWHVERGCRKAGRVLRDLQREQAQERRDQRCLQEVLTMTYLDVCLYFRDVVCPAAFQPCWEWSREMYRRCLDDDRAWFAPQE